MATDIHLHQEIKIGGVWQHYALKRVPRSYELFNKMAGVGDSYNHLPIREPRGIPDDSTFLTQFDYIQWEGNSNNPSWFNAKDIAKIISWLRLNDDTWQREIDSFGFLFSTGWESFYNYPKDRSPDIEDIRFIFWFDN
tara:strand:+ start:39 stop:452 length:414 start_codon:yes stop_codon:yes gene_type:complete